MENFAQLHKCKIILDWASSLLIKHLLHMCRVPGSIPGTAEQGKQAHFLKILILISFLPNCNWFLLIMLIFFSGCVLKINYENIDSEFVTSYGINLICLTKNWKLLVLHYGFETQSLRKLVPWEVSLE